MDAVDFGQKVRSLRKKEGLTQFQLADKIRISRNYLSCIETGDASNLSWDIKTKLCTALGISTDHESMVLPISLTSFAHADALPDDDVKMLAQLSYRGKQPDTPEKWRILYGIIKMIVETSDKQETLSLSPS